LKANLFTRVLAAKVLFLAVAFSFIATPSQAFFFHHHHWHHWKHWKKPPVAKKTPALFGSKGTPFAAQYAAASIACATISVMAQAAMNAGKPLSLGQAHGTAAGCFLPIVGQWLLVGHYQRMCALSRTNPALRDYRIYCAA
jgi:hypothetical protein